MDNNSFCEGGAPQVHEMFVVRLKMLNYDFESYYLRFVQYNK